MAKKKAIYTLHRYYIGANRMRVHFDDVLLVLVRRVVCCDRGVEGTQAVGPSNRRAFAVRERGTSEAVSERYFSLSEDLL